MTVEADYFIEYYDAAQSAILDERSSHMVGLRYGLADGKTHTLEQIADKYHISRERVRQIIEKANRRLIPLSYLKYSPTDPRIELCTYVRSIISPDADDFVDRLVSFVEALHLPSDSSLLSLIARLSDDSRRASENIRKAKKLLDEHACEKIEAAGVLRFGQLLASWIIWPKDVKKITQEDILSLKREREVVSQNTGHVGLMYSNKLGRDVAYESDMELKFLTMLENMQDVVVYQEQPLLITYGSGNSKWKYYPDVLFVYPDFKAVVVEIKPTFHMALKENLIKWTALRQFCVERGWGMVVTDCRHSIQERNNYPVYVDFASEVMQLLQAGPIDWPKYKTIIEKYHPCRDDFVALVLQNNLNWQLRPFRLSL